MFIATIGDILQDNNDFHIGVEQLAHTHNQNQWIIHIAHNKNLFLIFLRKEQNWSVAIIHDQNNIQKSIHFQFVNHQFIYDRRTCNINDSFFLWSINESKDR